MKDMIKRIREEREGFTLAELLIVVAIIAVLVAIAIPVFNGQLEKSRDTADAANVRSAYAEATAAYLTEDDTSGTTTYKYKLNGEGTDGTWSQNNSGTLEIAGVNVTAKAKAKGVTIVFKAGNIDSISLEESAPANDGKQTA